MFDQNQKRSLVVAGVALLAGLLVGALGCSSGTSETDVDGGARDGATVSGKVIPGISVAPLPGGGNPCGQAAGCTIDSCGWDSYYNLCYKTHWCVSSVELPSYGHTAVPGVTSNPDDGLTPVTAICSPDAGQGTYVFGTGTIYMWYGDPAQSTGGAGHLCAPSTSPLYVDCANY